MPIKHIAFDLDGTLIDSEHLMKYSWDKTTKELNINCGFNEYRKYIGLPFEIILEKLNLHKMNTEISEKYFESNAKNIELIHLNKGVQEILNFLDKYSITYSIVTSKPRSNTLEVLKYFNLPINFFVSSDDVKHGKPYPDSMKLIMDNFNIQEDDIIYVGDMMVDLSFAINSKVKFVHYVSGKGKIFNNNLIANYKSIDHLCDLKDFTQTKDS